MKTRLFSTTIALGGSLLLQASPVLSADYPTRSIELVVGYGAGGGTDVCFRALAKAAEDELGGTIVIDNKPGAGSSLSISYLTRQKPDGYKVAALSTGSVLNQFLVPDIEYDVMEDLTPIAMVAQYQVGFLVREGSDMESLDDVIEIAKKDPSAISYSTAGVGTPQHLTMEKLGEEVGAQWVHIPYKSGVEASTALARGDVEVMAQTAEWAPFVRDKRLKLLNVFTENRMEEFDYAPTLLEEGYDLVAPSILGLVGPHGMDEDIVKKIETAFQAATEDDEYKKCAHNFGLKADFKNSSDFSDYIQNTINNWAPVIKEMDLE